MNLLHHDLSYELVAWQIVRLGYTTQIKSLNHIGDMYDMKWCIQAFIQNTVTCLALLDLETCSINMFKNDTNDMYSCYNIFLCWDMGYHNFTSLTPEMKLRRAAKARIDRMTKNHPSRSHFKFPWVVEAWMERWWVHDEGRNRWCPTRGKFQQGSQFKKAKLQRYPQRCFKYPDIWGNIVWVKTCLQFFYHQPLVFHQSCFDFLQERLPIHFAYHSNKEADSADQERRRMVQRDRNGRRSQVVSVGTSTCFAKDVIYTCTCPSGISLWFAIAANICEGAMTYQGPAFKVPWPDVWQLASPIAGHPLMIWMWEFEPTRPNTYGYPSWFIFTLHGTPIWSTIAFCQAKCVWWSPRILGHCPWNWTQDHRAFLRGTAPEHSQGPQHFGCQTASSQHRFPDPFGLARGQHWPEVHHGWWQVWCPEGYGGSGGEGKDQGDWRSLTPSLCPGQGCSFVTIKDSFLCCHRLHICAWIHANVQKKLEILLW